MKPKPIGIIGGAGPLAGAFLLERVFYLSGKNYGCYRDADYPKVFLISFPFAEMLGTNMDVPKLKKQLRFCLKQLRKNGACILAIACNTLHAFLEEQDESSDLIHLPRLLAEEIPVSCEPLIFCTSTSRAFGLHRQFLPGLYPDAQTQQKVDGIIDQILKGIDRTIILGALENLLQTQVTETVILGCTELSLLSAHLAVPNKQIIDPLEILANKILEKSFL